MRPCGPADVADCAALHSQEGKHESALRLQQRAMRLHTQAHGLCALPVHGTCTACALPVHCMCTVCALHVHCMCTACARVRHARRRTAGGTPNPSPDPNPNPNRNPIPNPNLNNQAHGGRHVEVARDLSHIGNVLCDVGMLDAAAAAFREAHGRVCPSTEARRPFFGSAVASPAAWAFVG